jgi:hypothetical protein
MGVNEVHGGWRVESRIKERNEECQIDGRVANPIVGSLGRGVDGLKLKSL